MAPTHIPTKAFQSSILSLPFIRLQRILPVRLSVLHNRGPNNSHGTRTVKTVRCSPATCGMPFYHSQATSTNLYL